MSHLNNDKAAQYLGYTPQTLRLSRHTGTIGGVDAPKFSKRGRMIFYDVTDLDQWTEQFNVVSNTAECTL